MGRIVLYVCRYGVPERASPSTSRRPSSVPPASGSRGSAGPWACWSAGASSASESSGCRSTSGSSSIHGWMPPARVPRSVTATPWRRPGRGPPAGRLERSHGRRGHPGRPVEVRPGPRRGGVVEPGSGRTPSEPLFVRAARRPQRRRGLAAHGRRRRQPGASDLYVLDASVTGSRHDPRRSSTCRRGYRCAATGSGSRPIAIADAAVTAPHLGTTARVCAPGLSAARDGPPG